MRRPLLLLLAAWAPLAGAETLAGRALDARTSLPVAGVRVEAGWPRLTTVTDAAGRFALEGLPSGPLNLGLTARGYAPASLALESPSLDPLEIRLEPLPDIREELTVTPSGDSVAGALPLARGYEARDLLERSSVLASDPLRSLQALPGIAAGDDFSASFAARGYGFDSAALLLDGVLLHAPWHTMRDVADGYSLTIFNGEILERLDLMGGGAPAAYGERIGPVVSFRTRDGSRQRFGGRGSLAVSGLLGTLEGPLGASRRGSWLVSARKSYLDWILKRVDDDPRWALSYQDVTAKLSFDPRPAARLSLLLLSGRSHWRSTDEKLAAHSLAVAEAGTELASLSARFLFGARLQIEAQAAVAHETGDNRDQDGLRRFESALDHRTARAAALLAAGAHRLEAGVSYRPLAEAAVSRRFDARLPAPRIVLGYDRASAQWSGFLQDSWLRSRATLTLGLRVEGSGATGERLLLPRASLRFSPDAATRLVLAAGGYAQSPSFAELAGEHGNPELRAERSRHLVLSVERRLAGRLALRVDGYDQRDRGLFGNLELDYRLVDGRPAAPRAGALLRNAWSGSSRGVELTAATTGAGDSSAALSYAYSHARRREGALPAFDGDFDQRHTLSAFLRRRFAKGWVLAGSFRHGSGLPVAGFLAASGDGVALASERNGYRPRGYTRLDARGERSFKLRGARAALYLELANLLGNANRRYSEIDSVNLKTGRVRLDSDELLPLLPLFGLSLEF